MHVDFKGTLDLAVRLLVYHRPEGFEEFESLTSHIFLPL